MKIKFIIYSILLFVAFILILDKVIMPLYINVEHVKVPSVVGLTFEQGKKILEDAGLNPVNGGERFDDRYPKGTIILQRPAANKVVKEGRRIYIIVSGGVFQVDVPDIKYKTLDEARIILERVGLQIGNIMEDTTSDVPRGLIVQQSIPANSKVGKGTLVDVYVSNYTTSERIEVPDLKGMSLSEVKAILANKNLKVGKIVYQPSLDFLPNTVIYQYPGAGTYVTEGTLIDLVVVKEKISGEEIIE